jgi:hypothetical protein
MTRPAPTSPATTAPHPSRHPPATTTSTGSSPRQPPAQPRHPHGRRRPNPQHRHRGRIYYDRKRAEGMTGKCALRTLKRKISDSIYARLTADDRATRETWPRTRDGTRGMALHPARPAHTPLRRLFGETTPGLPTSLEPTIKHRSPPDPQRHLSVGLDIKRPRYAWRGPWRSRTDRLLTGTTTCR